MTPVTLESDDGMDQDRRGTNDAPAEGRRNYDKPDVSVDRITHEVTRLRRLVLGFASLGLAAFAILGWFGFRAVGPGARVDDLQAGLTRESATRSYSDSVLSVRMSRVERVETTQAYQSCVQHNAQNIDCARIFTDGMN